MPTVTLSSVTSNVRDLLGLYGGYIAIGAALYLVWPVVRLVFGILTDRVYDHNWGVGLDEYQRYDRAENPGKWKGWD